MKKLFFLLIACLFGASCAFAGASAQSSKTQSSKTQSNHAKAQQNYAKTQLKFAVPNNVGNLNPHSYSGEMFAQDMVYEGLVSYSQEGTIVPSLASSWQISDDGLVYTFVLKSGVEFSNGEKFDAKAVKANLDAVFGDESAHSWSALFGAYKDSQIINDHTIKITLKHPYEPTLRELSLVRPYRFAAPSMIGTDNPAGTGKWMLKASKLGEWDEFIQNPRYHGTKPKLQSIKCVVIPDTNTRVIALRTGAVDYIYGNPSYLNSTVSLDEFVKLSKDSRYQTIITKPINTTLIALNSSKAPLDSKQVRQAISYAVDKNAISKYVYYGTQPAAEYFYPDEVASISSKAYKYDNAKALSLLNKSGYKQDSSGKLLKNGKQLELSLYYIGTDAEQRMIAQVLQAQLGAIGIKLNLYADETSAFYKRQKTGEFDMIFHSTWGAPYEPEIFMASFRVRAHADYVAQSGLSQKPQIDKSIEQISSSTDEKQKTQLIKQVLTILHDEAVYIPVVYNTNKGVASSKLKGIKGSIVGYEVPFEDIYFIQ